MYLDPGIGSMIIQFVVAAIAACGGLLFAFRNRVKAYFDRKKGIVPPEEAETLETDASDTPSAADPTANAKEESGDGADK